MKPSAQSGGHILREARRNAGLSQQELAARAGVAQSVISVYESGRRQPALPTLVSLVEATDHELHLELRPLPGLDRLRGPLGRRLRAVRSDVKSVAQVHGATILAVFGSVARGEDDDDSDVDLLVELPSTMGLFGLARLRRDLERVLDAPVDLVPERDLKSGVRDTVISESIAI